MGCEYLFQDAVIYNKRMSKGEGKPRIKNIGIGRRVVYLVKTTQEVIEELNKLGINVSERTLQLWARQELIPKPETKAAGRGKGKTAANHSDDTPFEGYASASLIRGMRAKPDDVCKARKKALLAESKIAGSIADYLRVVMTPAGTLDTLWLRWLYLKLEAQDPTGDILDEFKNKAHIIDFANFTFSNLVKAGVNEDSEKRIKEAAESLNEEDRGIFVETLKACYQRLYPEK